MGRAARGALPFALLCAGALAVLLPALAAPASADPRVTLIQPADGALLTSTLGGGGGSALVFIEAYIVDDYDLYPSNTTARLVRGDGGDGWTRNLPLSVLGPDSLSVRSYETLDDGPYRLLIDSENSIGASVHFESAFLVDSIEPELEVTAPTVSADPSAQVIVDVREAGSGLVLPLILSYRSACSSSWEPLPMDVTLLPGRAVGRATLALCEGTTNQFTVTVQDLAGNTRQVIQRKITYDTTAPTFTGFRPGPFETLDGTNATLEVWVSDNGVGVNSSSVEAQVSLDGGIRWGPWRKATVLANGTYVRAVVLANLSSGGTAAVRWRAADTIGNGPAESRAQYFYMNGPPFVVSFEPAEGSVVWENSTVRIDAKFADPDADTVRATVSSDIDGNLGLADGRRVRLSGGIHNLTLEGDDGHGHVVRYTYQVEVISRLPPDLRPLFFTCVIAGTMLWAAYATWTRERDREERAAKA